MNKDSPTIGPHEGIELKLMLEGKKNLALFYSDYEIPEEFHKRIEQKALFLNTVKIKTRLNGAFIDFFIISKARNDENVLKLASLIRKSLSEIEFNPEVERGIGRLLGYRELDIEYFIKRKIERREDKK